MMKKKKKKDAKLSGRDIIKIFFWNFPEGTDDEQENLL
jgi:hypothetical protein